MARTREVYATEYICETVACYERMVRVMGSDVSHISSELQWAEDVLREFFRVTGHHPKIELAREQFRNITLPRAGDARTFLPRKRGLLNDPPLTWEQLEQLARQRRSVRWFLPTPVPREIIDRAISVAGESPSACNRQPFVFHVFDKGPLLRQVVKIPGGIRGYEQSISALAVIVGQLRSFFSERDRHLIYIDGALAAMSFVLALEVQGVSSCCINWPDVESKGRALADLLKLESDERPVMCVAFGYADPNGLVASSPKKPLAQLRRYNLE